MKIGLAVGLSVYSCVATAPMRVPAPDEPIRIEQLSEQELVNMLPPLDQRFTWDHSRLTYRYSPQRDAIMFMTRTMTDAPPGVWLIELDQPDHERLAVGSSKVRQAPAWSPDGSTVAATGFENRMGKVCLIDRETWKRVDIVSLKTIGLSNPAWSPDGDEVAVYLSQREERPKPHKIDGAYPDLMDEVARKEREEYQRTDESYALVLFNRAGSETARIEALGQPEEINNSVGWSPDGRYVAVVTEVLSSTDDHPMRIRIFDVREGALVHTESAYGWFRGKTPPQWSDDSRQIAISLGSGVLVLDQDDSGSFAESRVVGFGDRLVDAFAWMPQRPLLLVLTCEEETKGIASLFGGSSERTYRFVPWVCDPVRGERVPIEEYAATSSFSGPRPAMIPRVAGAFASWTR